MSAAWLLLGEAGEVGLLWMLPVGACVANCGLAVAKAKTKSVAKVGVDRVDR